MVTEKVNEFQRQALDLLKTQHEAYLEAVRTWKNAMSASAGVKMPPWPETPPMDTLPTPGEVAEASTVFAAKVLEEQSRFMNELSETLSATSKKR